MLKAANRSRVAGQRAAEGVLNPFVMALLADWFVPHTKKPVDPFATGACSPIYGRIIPDVENGTR